MVELTAGGRRGRQTGRNWGKASGRVVSGRESRRVWLGRRRERERERSGAGCSGAGVISGVYRVWFGGDLDRSDVPTFDVQSSIVE